MKFILHLITFLSITMICCTGCGISKRATDNQMIRTLQSSEELIKEAATIAVFLTLDSAKKYFTVKEIDNKEIRNKLGSLGDKVEVAYKNNGTYEFSDSTVTFSTLQLAGVIEVIYDFATRPRTVLDNTSNRKQYYFTKVKERIYYRRRLFPMM